MGIEKIGLRGPIAIIIEASKGKEKKSGQPGSVDRVELSEEAKLMFAAQKARITGEIRAKVKNGFYNSPEVTEQVADGLIRDLQHRRQV